MTRAFHLKLLTAHVFRAPIETPVTTAFGVMRDRPMVLVRAEDRDGTVGWGEVWCNFPQVGAEHRARLVDSILAPIATSGAFVEPVDLFERLTVDTAVLAIQSGERGPFAQAIAGVDTAAWDVVARKTGQPLWRLLGGSSPSIRVYASGLNPTAPEVLAQCKQGEGYRAFKLKIGFGIERDIANLDALRKTLGASAELMVDANQAWTLDQALELAPLLERFKLAWLEEPLRADRPWSEWRQLKEATSVPLAAGENIAGFTEFQQILDTKILSVVQPDLAKWGGISGCRPVAAAIGAAGATYCPHYLGGGIGLLASAHLLAAIGVAGRLEIDANANPLRTLLCAPLTDIADGYASLGDNPGLGLAPDLATIQRFLVPH